MTCFIPYNYLQIDNLFICVGLPIHISRVQTPSALVVVENAWSKSKELRSGSVVKELEA